MPLRAIQRFLQLESASGILLVAFAALAMTVANLPWTADAYHHLLEIPIEVRLGDLILEKNFLHLVNDGLMAIFFLLVALEIKREVLEGELSSVGQMMLPGIAALGGVIAPGGIYALFNYASAVDMRGWAIPTATDIAFSLGVLMLLGRRVPLSLKVFLTTLAVADDLAAIVIIAVAYTDHLSLTSLLLAMVALAVLVALNRAGVARAAPYFVVGAFLWLFVLESGVHATLAGVALGFTIPMTTARGETKPLLRHIEHRLHPWVAYGILPLFSFCNAGVSFTNIEPAALVGPIALGIATGLIVGKPVGITLATCLTIALKLAPKPRGATWGAVAGVACLGGIGFTMSLFIGQLAFEGQSIDHAVATRVGVLGGSLVSALIGLTVLHLTLPAAPAATAATEEASNDHSV